MEIFNRKRMMNITIFSPPLGSVYWRLCLFVSNERDKILRELLSRGVRVSSWFPSVDLFFEGQRENRCLSVESDRSGSQMLNIWVDSSVDKECYHNISEVLFENYIDR